MAKVYKNTVNIGGDYIGTVTISGPVLLGENISSDGANTPVVITGNGTSASSIAPYSFVGGQLARSESSLSFIWNGSDFQDGDAANTPFSDTNPYLGANQEGTFSINPNGNLDGTFIGSKSLKTHMGELSGFVAQALSSSSFLQENNIVHKTGTETVSGVKTFISSIAVGSSNNNNVVIDNSSIHINSNNNGGLLFHFNGNSTPTASLKETESGTLTFGSKLNVTGESTFNSNNNTFNGISIRDNALVDFTNGTAQAKTVDYDTEDIGDNTVATTEYVCTAIRESAFSGMDTRKNEFQGETIFANTVELSSKSVTGVLGGVVANFVPGQLYVANQDGTVSSSIAANTNFVKNVVASLSASLRGNKNSIGSGVVPIYLTGTSSLNASLVQSTSDVGSSTVPIYMTGGSLTRMSEDIGNINSPVYLNGGSITQCNTLVNVTAKQDVIGEKSFTTPAWFKSAPRVYVDAEKGNANSYNKHCYVDFCLSSLHSEYNHASLRIGLVGTFVESSGKFTQSYLSAYTNKMNDTAYVSIGVRISPDGKERYMVGTSPTDGSGASRSITDEYSTIIPTVGWSNKYYARKDGATFTGGVTFNTTVSMKSGVELYGSTPYIDFHYNNTTKDNTARIIEDAIGQLRIIPCAASLGGTDADSAASIRLGTKTIGSVNRPIYVSEGRITACNNGTVVGQWSCQGERTSNSSMRFGWIPTTTTPSSIKIVFSNPSSTAYIASIGGNGSQIAAKNSKTWLMTYSAETDQKLYIENAAVTCNMIAIAY